MSPRSFDAIAEEDLADKGRGSRVDDGFEGMTDTRAQKFSQRRRETEALQNTTVSPALRTCGDELRGILERISSFSDATLDFPASIGPLSVNLCLQLLNPDPISRLECLAPGFLTRNPFFYDRQRSPSTLRLEECNAFEDILRQTPGNESITESVLEFTPHERGKIFAARKAWDLDLDDSIRFSYTGSVSPQIEPPSEPANSGTGHSDCSGDSGPRRLSGQCKHITHSSNMKSDKNMCSDNTVTGESSSNGFILKINEATSSLGELALRGDKGGRPTKVAPYASEEKHDEHHKSNSPRIETSSHSKEAPRSRRSRGGELPQAVPSQQSRQSQSNHTRRSSRYGHTTHLSGWATSPESDQYLTKNGGNAQRPDRPQKPLASQRDSSEDILHYREPWVGRLCTPHFRESYIPVLFAALRSIAAKESKISISDETVLSYFSVLTWAPVKISFDFYLRPSASAVSASVTSSLKTGSTRHSTKETSSSTSSQTLNKPAHEYLPPDNPSSQCQPTDSRKPAGKVAENDGGRMAYNDRSPFQVQAMGSQGPASAFSQAHCQVATTRNAMKTRSSEPSPSKSEPNYDLGVEAIPGGGPAAIGGATSPSICRSSPKRFVSEALRSFRCCAPAAGFSMAYKILTTDSSSRSQPKPDRSFCVSTASTPSHRGNCSCGARLPRSSRSNQGGSDSTRLTMPVASKSAAGKISPTHHDRSERARSDRQGSEAAIASTKAMFAQDVAARTIPRDPSSGELSSREPSASDLIGSYPDNSDPVDNCDPAQATVHRPHETGNYSTGEAGDEPKGVYRPRLTSSAIADKIAGKYTVDSSEPEARDGSAAAARDVSDGTSRQSIKSKMIADDFSENESVTEGPYIGVGVMTEKCGLLFFTPEGKLRFVFNPLRKIRILRTASTKPTEIRLEFIGAGGKSILFAREFVLQSLGIDVGLPEFVDNWLSAFANFQICGK